MALASTNGPEESTSKPDSLVLVPVDFSSCSLAALKFAANLVQSTSAPLVVMHVVHDRASNPGLYRSKQEPGLPRPFRDIAKEMLEEFVDDACSNCWNAAAPVKPGLLVVNGIPATRILEIAMREHAALIVMGTRGRAGLARLANGSVTAEVTRKSMIPVTIVKSPATGTACNKSEHVDTHWWSRGTSSRENQDSGIQNPDS